MSFGVVNGWSECVLQLKYQMYIRGSFDK